MKKKNDMDRPSIEELQFLQALNSSYRLLLNYGARRIKEMEITMAQAYMLVFLGLHPDMTLEDISKELLLAKSAIHLTLHQPIFQPSVSSQHFGRYVSYNIRYGTRTEDVIEIPQKQSDEKYTHTFEGWEEDVSTFVTDNAVYTAKFSTKVNKDQDGVQG